MTKDEQEAILRLFACLIDDLLLAYKAKRVGDLPENVVTHVLEMSSILDPRWRNGMEEYISALKQRMQEGGNQ